MVSRLNGGTIPDRGNYAVHLWARTARGSASWTRRWCSRRAPGENILLGASTWRVEKITRDRVIVSPAPGEPGRLPFWRGDGPGRPIELGRALGALRARARRHERAQGARLAARAHARSTPTPRPTWPPTCTSRRPTPATLPTDRSLTVERFRDELGDWRVCILTPFGARMHAPWAMALQAMLARRTGFEVQMMYTDDGIVLRFADVDELPELEALLPDPDEVEELVTEQLAADGAVRRPVPRERRPRAAAAAARRPGPRTPLWAQRLKAQHLLAAVRSYPSFPIVLETYRQALQRRLRSAGLRAAARAICRRKVRVRRGRDAAAPRRSPARWCSPTWPPTCTSRTRPLAERRAQALTLDRDMLAELLGQAELRELLDPEVMEEAGGRAAASRRRDPGARARTSCTICCAGSAI